MHNSFTIFHRIFLPTCTASCIFIDETTESGNESKEIKLPPKQTFGKGKRARIPNKRYSDVLLSPKLNHSDADKPAKKIGLENGLTDGNSDIGEKENIESDSDLGIKSDSASSPMVTSLKSSRTSLSGSPASKKQKVAVDLTNPNFLKPFQYGWKRELVYRATNDNSAKRNGDIYYYTPGGKKVRSMREVSENLKNKELSLEDFTFFKEPLGLDDPEKEIIRDAKFKSVGVLPKRSFTPKAKVTKSLSPKVTASPPVTENTPSPTTESPKSKNSSRIRSFKVRKKMFTW